MTTTHKKASTKTSAPEAAPIAAGATAQTNGGTASADSAVQADTPLTTQRQPGDRQAIAGIKRNFTALTTITLLAREFSPAQLIALFQDRVDAADKTDESERTYHDDVAAERKTEALLAPVRASLQKYLAARYGATSNKMKEFGVAPPRKRKKPDTVTLANAQKLAGATRVARGTVGKRKKLKIKGQLPLEPAVAKGDPSATTGTVATGTTAGATGPGTTNGAKS